MEGVVQLRGLLLEIAIWLIWLPASLIYNRLASWVIYCRKGIGFPGSLLHEDQGPVFLYGLALP